VAASWVRDARRTFPLVPRKRLIGLPFGEVASRRRGRGSEVIGLRPYERGDPVTTIDWPASARLSATSGTDAFVVRDHAADEAPRVVLVVDRRPAMALYPEPLPWLAKRDALREAAAAIAGSAAAAQADVGALDFGAGEAWWLPPGRRDRRWLIAEREGGDTPFDAPEDTLERSLAFLDLRRAHLPSGSFIFVLSDFLEPPSPDALRRAVGHGWDVVPVVIQDPVWEQSFPQVAGVALPVADPRRGVVELVRMTRRQADARREANARRQARLLEQFTAFGLRPVAIGTSNPRDIDTLFIEWSRERSGIQRAR
jgi:uncharacterized protein (DUF58 family)